MEYNYLNEFTKSSTHSQQPTRSHALLSFKCVATLWPSSEWLPGLLSTPDCTVQLDWRVTKILLKDQLALMGVIVLVFVPSKMMTLLGVGHTVSGHLSELAAFPNIPLLFSVCL